MSEKVPYNIAQLHFSLDPLKPARDCLPLVHGLSPSSDSPVESGVKASRQMPPPLENVSDRHPVTLHSPLPPPSDLPLHRPHSSSSHSPPGIRRDPKSSIEHESWQDGAHSSTPVSHATANMTGHEHSKVSLPSIFTSFKDPFHHDVRRTSAPGVYMDSNDRRYQPYRRRPDPTSLATYSFPSPMDPDRAHYGLESAYPHSHPPASSDSSIYSAATSTPSTGIPQGHVYSPLTPSDHPRAYSQPHIYNEWSPAPSHSSSTLIRQSQQAGTAIATVPLSPPSMYAGAARISGQVDRRNSAAMHKHEDASWGYPSSSPAAPVVPSNAPSDSLSASPTNAPRKRGKLPKETTDYLKTWLHRHAEHPYPSEEEKKQLCSATNLSMSQVSNWMINARRRILAPANRLASNPSTTTPMSNGNRTVNGGPDRRASAPVNNGGVGNYQQQPGRVTESPTSNNRGRAYSGSGSEYTSPSQTFTPSPLSAPAHFNYQQDWNSRQATSYSQGSQPVPPYPPPPPPNSTSPTLFSHDHQLQHQPQHHHHHQHSSSPRTHQASTAAAE